MRGDRESHPGSLALLIFMVQMELGRPVLCGLPLKSEWTPLLMLVGLVASTGGPVEVCKTGNSRINYKNAELSVQKLLQHP